MRWAYRLAVLLALILIRGQFRTLVKVGDQINESALVNPAVSIHSNFNASDNGEADAGHATVTKTTTGSAPITRSFKIQEASLVEPAKQTLPPGSNEEAFYTYHRERIQVLVNESSAIVWDTRRDKNNSIGSLWEHFPGMYRPGKFERKNNPTFNTSNYWFWGSICEVAKAVQKYEKENGAGHALPRVYFFRMNENWGGFSQTIANKTADWVRDLVQSWKGEGCTKEMIFEFLDHPDTLQAVTVQFQEFYHPKVLSLPLGILDKKKVSILLDKLGLSPPMRKTQLLMVNNKPRRMRDPTVNAVIRNFNNTLRNTYGTDQKSYKNFWDEMRRSKFLLSPGGLGFDCYRHWEAILMGTIPVIETLNRTDNWFKVFDSLPVAWVDFFENLTPEYLELTYEEIMSKAHSYKYEKLTKKYWIDHIKSFVENANNQEQSK